MSDLDGLPAELREDIERSRKYFGRDPVAFIIGEHPSIVAERETMRAIERMPAGTRPPALLITGEHGTGKTCAAGIFRLIGPRRKGFGDTILDDLPAEEVECILFGSDSFGGHLDLIHEGVVLIERVETFPERLQERLHRHIVGPPIGAWVISTSAVDLERLVREGRFSLPLYEALRGMCITLPPLRDRGFDIIRLAERFIAFRCVSDGREPDAVRLRPDAIDALLGHPWPGNLTEIVAVMDRAYAAATNDRIAAANLAI